MSLLPPSPLLPEVIAPGDPGHIGHHEEIHHILNDLAGSGPFAVEAPTTLGVRYAAPWGDDAHDGMSWGAAKKYVMSAYDALPSTGGTVYIADSTQCDTAADTGIWVTGPADPNYSSLPAGWRKAKGAPSFVGVGGSVGSRHGTQATIHGGSGTDATKPAIAVFVQSGASFENLCTDYVKRPIRVGMTSAGAPSTQFHLGTYWNNVQARVGGTSPGPNWSFESSGDTSFWHHVEWFDTYANNSATIGTDARSVMVCNGTYLLTVKHGVMTYGGIKFTTPSVSWNLIVDDVQGEGSFSAANPPLVTLLGSQFAGYALLTNLDMYDAPGTACVIYNDALPASCVLTAGIGTAGILAVVGPHTNLGFERVTNGSLAAKRSYGPERWRDVGRRQFSMSHTPSVPQLANHLPSSWGGRSHGMYPTGGNATVTAVTGPNGVPNAAGRLTFTSAGMGTREVNASRTLAIGDFVVFAVWADRRVVGSDSSIGPGFVLPTSGFAASTDLLNEYGAAGGQFIATDPQTFGPFDRPSPIFYTAACRVTAVGTNPCSIVGELNVDQNGTIDYFNPMIYHFPGASWTAERVASFVNGMGTVPYMPNLFSDDGDGGDLVSQFGQRMILPGGVMVVADQDTGAGGFYGMPAGSLVLYKHDAGQQLVFSAAGVYSWVATPRTVSSTADRFSIQNNATQLELGEPTTDADTALLLRRNVGGSYSLQRVSMGATDSGGSGFKLLRVPN